MHLIPLTTAALLTLLCAGSAAVAWYGERPVGCGLWAIAALFCWVVMKDTHNGLLPDEEPRRPDPIANRMLCPKCHSRPVAALVADGSYRCEMCLKREQAEKGNP